MNKFAPTSQGLLTVLDKWLLDKDVTEIVLNEPQQVYVEKNGKFTPYKIPEFTERALVVLFQLIANENEQELSQQKPLLSGSLQDGARIQLVLPPIAKFHAFAIRRRVKQNFTLQDYRATDFYQNSKKFYLHSNETYNLNLGDKELLKLYQQNNWSELIKLAISLKKNIVISGGTSSGKTTFLNACLNYIPRLERIITLEDTREIVINHPNRVQLLAAKGEQGLAVISMQDLVQCCLRLRPDRIICGEIRGKEVLDFIAACATGHEGSITTIHANNPRVAFMRMVQMYKLNNVPFMTDDNIMRELHEVVDFIFQLTKTPACRCLQSVYCKLAMQLQTLRTLE